MKITRNITIKTLAIVFVICIFWAIAVDAKYDSMKDYYSKYKYYKEKYRELDRDYKKLKKKYDKRGVELESYYMDMIQCQRAINGDNPWDFMINK